MTTIYFIRHAEPNYANHDDLARELSAKGLEDRKLVTEYLQDKHIDIVLSSPYKRAIDTVKHFADNNHYTIKIIDDFRERKAGTWIEDFDAFCRQQRDDFSFKLPGGEALCEVQERNIRALKQVLKEYRDKTIVIGSHGTALGTIIQYFDHAFGYEDFARIKSLMPWIVRFTFSGDTMQEIISAKEFKTIYND